MHRCSSMYSLVHLQDREVHIFHRQHEYLTWIRIKNRLKLKLILDMGFHIFIKYRADVKCNSRNRQMNTFHDLGTHSFYGF